MGENSWQRFANGCSAIPLTAFSRRLDPKLNPGDLNDFPEDYFTPEPDVLTPEQLAALTPEEMAARQAQIDQRTAEISQIGGKSLTCR